MSDKQMVRMIGQIEEMKSLVQNYVDGLQDTFDGRSETWQQDEKGEAASAKIDSLNEAVAALEGAYEALNNATSE